MACMIALLPAVWLLLLSNAIVSSLPLTSPTPLLHGAPSTGGAALQTAQDTAAPNTEWPHQHPAGNACTAAAVAASGAGLSPVQLAPASTTLSEASLSSSRRWSVATTHGMLKPGETARIEIVLSVALSCGTAAAAAKGLVAGFVSKWAAIPEEYEARWQDAFVPPPQPQQAQANSTTASSAMSSTKTGDGGGSDGSKATAAVASASQQRHFGGNWPVLETGDEELRRTYYGSLMSMLLVNKQGIDTTMEIEEDKPKPAAAAEAAKAGAVLAVGGCEGTYMALPAAAGKNQPPVQLHAAASGASRKGGIGEQQVL
eukprot:COSAG02_NODE_6377_length_3612_cov_2.589525_4_plen_314_part_01